jgi:Na+-transporting methylmalonyl-CoA/oxaloacetate decarboxylase beta subunit
VLPATAIPGRPLLVGVLAGQYPLLDVVIVMLGVNLAFTTAIRQPSFMFLGATAQRDVLAALKVPLAQGWLWGRAVPASAFAENLRARERVGEPVVVRSD